MRCKLPFRDGQNGWKGSNGLISVANEGRLILGARFSKDMTKPFLYDIVDKLYHVVMDPMPHVIREREQASAFVLGTAGIYGVARAFQWASRHIIDKVIPGFDENALPVFEKICIAGMAAAPILYALIDPEGAKAITAQHPVYAAGMAGVYAGSISGAVQDLVKRSKGNTLEERTK